MKDRVNRVLLVDDDGDANFFHERIIRKSNFAEHIDIARNGAEALEYLNNCIASKQELPEVIFLDLNMPGIDGWTFLEKYTQFDKAIKNKIVVIILTSSINPDDVERATHFPEVKGFKSKFLDAAHLSEVLQIVNE